MPQIQDQHFMQPGFNMEIIDEELRPKFGRCVAYVLPFDHNGRAAVALIKEDNVIIYHKVSVDKDVVTLYVSRPIPQEFHTTLGIIPVP